MLSSTLSSRRRMGEGGRGGMGASGSSVFGIWLRRQLARRDGMPQAQFARRAGVSPGTVSDWINGHRKPKAELADRIADALGVDTDEVLALLGVRPAEPPSPADEPRGRIVALVNRVRLTEDRVVGLEGTLRGWIEFDR